MRSVTIEALRLIARGGQAEIYDFEDGKVLRVAKRPQDFDRIRYEYDVYASLSESGLTVPRTYELIEVDGAPAIIMDKLTGTSMMTLIAKNPFTVRAKARELARLHLALRTVTPATVLTPTKAKSEFCIKHSEILSDQTKECVLKVLADLPEGYSLCHGDFHPGNIICSANKNYLIDWVGATRGDFCADVAHTYVLLRVVPRVPHMNKAVHFMQRQVARAMAKSYLGEISAQIAIDRRVLSKWVLVNAAERTYHGLESEKRDLKIFIDTYMEALSRNANQEELYQLI